jgi:O-antigen ligase
VWLGVAAIGLLLLLTFTPGRLSPSAPTPGGLLSRLTDTLQYAGARDLADIKINDDNFAVIERAAHWLAAWRMFETHPWLGVGTGQYASIYPSVALPRWQDPLGHAHNYFLQVLAEGGLLGLAAYLVLMLAALSMAWRAAWRERGWPRTVAWGVLGMLGHLLAHNTFDNLYVHGMYLLVAMALGMLAPLALAPEASPRIPDHPEVL